MKRLTAGGEAKGGLRFS